MIIKSGYRKAYSRYHVTRLCEQLFGLIRKASMLRFSGSFCSHFLTFDVCFQKNHTFNWIDTVLSFEQAKGWAHK